MREARAGEIGPGNLRKLSRLDKILEESSGLASKFYIYNKPAFSSKNGLFTLGSMENSLWRILNNIIE